MNILKFVYNSHNRNKQKSRETSTDSYGDDAQKKFGNAKAISSDQFFGGKRDLDVSLQCCSHLFQKLTYLTNADKQ
jgi:hypothetical protein